MRTRLVFIISLILLGYSLSVAQPGSLDLSFDPGTGAFNPIFTTSIQPDGKIIIGGQFTSYNGTARNGIARLNADGSLDATFEPGTGLSDPFNPVVVTTSIQSDGKIIIGGQFTSYNGTARSKIARLNSDGSLDTTFNPGTGTNSIVYTISIQSDGKIIIGGRFASYNGTARSNIARLNTDGSLDFNFAPGTGVSDPIYPIVFTTSIQSDGKIIIGGRFTSYNGTVRNCIARLNADGSLDTSFNPGTGVTDPSDNYVSTTSIQNDGKIIIGGDFLAYNGMAVNRIARLNSDGSLDTSFGLGTGADVKVSTTSIQSDGKIIIGGAFTTYNGTARSNIARLNTDGSLDTSFDPGTGAKDTVYPSIYTTSIQSDGKIIIGGDFNSYNGTARNSIARLESTPTGIHQLENAIRNVYVFPNPFSNTTKIHTESELKNAVLTVYNSLGQSVKQITRINIGAGHTISLNRDNLPGGLYFIRLSQGNQIIMTDKLVVAD